MNRAYDENTAKRVRKVSDYPDPPALVHGSRWGLWVLDVNRLCLCAVRDGVSDPEQSFYEIDLETITSPFWLIDWLEQMREKTWVTPEVMGYLTMALLDLFSPRTDMRAASAAGSIKPAEVLRRRLSGEH